MQQPRQAAGRLQQHDLSLDIAAQIGVRIDQRVSNAGLGRQVHDPVDPAFLGEQLRDGVAIGDIEAPEGEAGPALKSGQPGFLQPDVVVVIQVVDADARSRPGR